MNSFFYSAGAKKEMIRLYFQKLDKLPIRYELMKIETTFGDTNLVITGPKEKPALVLLHGANACAPLAIDAMIGLVNDFRIYAVDIPGQPNLSEEFRLNAEDNSYGEWMYEILSRLGIYNTTLVGISLGGFIALKTLTFDEKRIARAFLISPAGILNGNPLELFLKVCLRIKWYRMMKNTKHIRQVFEAVYSENDGFAEAFLAMIGLNYRIDFSSFPSISKQEAAKVKTPLTVFSAQSDILFPGERLLKRAKCLFPSLTDVVLLKDSKHIPSKTDYRDIANFIRKNS